MPQGGPWVCTLSVLTSSFLTDFRLALRSMEPLCLEPRRARIISSADTLTFLRAGFLNFPPRSWTFIFSSLIWSRQEAHAFNLFNDQTSHFFSSKRHCFEILAQLRSQRGDLNTQFKRQYVWSPILNQRELVVDTGHVVHLLRVTYIFVVFDHFVFTVVSLLICKVNLWMELFA